MVFFYFMWSKLENSKNSFCDVTLENAISESSGKAFTQLQLLSNFA